MTATPARDATPFRFCVLSACWNTAYVERMVEAALAVLAQHGARDVVRREVPGSYELPLAALWAARSGAFDAVLAFGVVIRGGTEHFRLVAEAASEGLMRVALDTGVPILNGVLACDDPAQAEARTGGAMGNRGAEVALAAIEMATQRRTHGFA